MTQSLGPSEQRAGAASRSAERIVAESIGKVVPWERHLRVTLTFDVKVPDDRMLVDKIESVVRDTLLVQGFDNTPARSLVMVDGTAVEVFYYYVNRYRENGKLVKVVSGERGGQIAPEIPE